MWIKHLIDWLKCRITRPRSSRKNTVKLDNERWSIIVEGDTEDKHRSLATGARGLVPSGTGASEGKEDEEGWSDVPRTDWCRCWKHMDEL